MFTMDDFFFIGFTSHLNEFFFNLCEQFYYLLLAMKMKVFQWAFKCDDNYINLCNLYKKTFGIR